MLEGGKLTAWPCSYQAKPAQNNWSRRVIYCTVQPLEGERYLITVKRRAEKVEVQLPNTVEEERGGRRRKESRDFTRMIMIIACKFLNNFFPSHSSGFQFSSRYDCWYKYSTGL